jgi:hypothetical protein
MTDKERILTYIAQRVFSMNLFPESRRSFYDKAKEKLEIGDIVVCSTSGHHDFTFAILVEKGKGFFDKPWILKDLITDKLCNMSNESFYKLPIDIPSHIFLSGTQLKIYEKCRKATNYNNRYKDIHFDKDICTLELREAFSREKSKEIKFKYNSKTTIKEIAKLIDEQ